LQTQGEQAFLAGREACGFLLATQRQAQIDCSSVGHNGSIVA
jgi:hypothetical protein